MIRRLALHPAVLRTLIALAVIKTAWGGLTWNAWHVTGGLGALAAYWWTYRQIREEY